MQQRRADGAWSCSREHPTHRPSKALPRDLQSLAARLGAAYHRGVQVSAARRDDAAAAEPWCSAARAAERMRSSECEAAEGADMSRVEPGWRVDFASGTPFNMGGRTYDPVYGRFMQADIAASVYNAQSLNRYSYALNRPLSPVAPSGYCPQTAGFYIGIEIGSGGVGFCLGSNGATGGATVSELEAWGRNMMAAPPQGGGFAGGGTATDQRAVEQWMVRSDDEWAQGMYVATISMRPTNRRSHSSLSGNCLWPRD